MAAGHLQVLTEIRELAVNIGSKICAESGGIKYPPNLRDYLV